MANLSDAYGTVRVSRAGKEFVEFVKAVQGPDAYYLLVDSIDNEPDSENDLEFTFGANGRWAYEANLDGYLGGEWMKEDAESEAYGKLLEDLKRTGGSIEIEYTDSDTATDWMGEGLATLRVAEDGTIEYNNDFNSEPITVTRYADQQGLTEFEALDYLYGDEVSDKYLEYIEKWKEEHKSTDGMPEPNEWYESTHIKE